VREQSSQQEPFFQNSAQQQPFVDQGIYPKMEPPAQGYDPRFNASSGQMQSMPQPPFLQANPQGNPGNFYGQHQPMMNQPQGYGFGPATPSQHPGMMNQEAYMHPQLNAQMANYQGNNFQTAGFQTPGFQGFTAPGQPPHAQPHQPYSQATGAFVPDETRQDGSKQTGVSPMAFWHETQVASGFDDGEGETANSTVKLLVAVAGVALIAAFSWFAYKWAKAPSSDTPPLIHAEPGPHKVSPDHRGGLNIPYQDKLIYNRIGDGATDDPAERLLPPPEQPEMMQNPEKPGQEPQFDDHQNTTQQPMYSEMPVPQHGLQPQRMAPQQGYTQQQSNQPQNIPLTQQPQEQFAAQPEQKVEAETEVEVAPTTTKTKSVETLSGNFFVQLATVKSEAAALKEWKRLQAKHSLKGMKSQIKESEMPDGEVVYRLLMGPFTAKVKALKHAVKIDGTKVVHVTD